MAKIQQHYLPLVYHPVPQDTWLRGAKHSCHRLVSQKGLDLGQKRLATAGTHVRFQILITLKKLNCVLDIRGKSQSHLEPTLPPFGVTNQVVSFGDLATQGGQEHSTPRAQVHNGV